LLTLLNAKVDSIPVNRTEANKMSEYNVPKNVLDDARAASNSEVLGRFPVTIWHMENHIDRTILPWFSFRSDFLMKPDHCRGILTVLPDDYFDFIKRWHAAGKPSLEQ